MHCGKLPAVDSHRGGKGGGGSPRGWWGGGQHCHSCKQHGGHIHVPLLTMATPASQPKQSARVTGQHPQLNSNIALHHVHKRAFNQMCCRSAHPTTWQLSCST
jgi:hypothetical protein